MSERTVHYWRDRPEVAEEVNRLSSKHAAGILGLARQRVRRELADGGEESLQAALRILNIQHFAAYAGGAPLGTTRSDEKRQDDVTVVQVMVEEDPAPDADRPTREAPESDS